MTKRITRKGKKEVKPDADDPGWIWLKVLDRETRKEGRPRRVKRLATFWYGRSECAVHWPIGGRRGKLKASHVRTGMSLFVVPVYVSRKAGGLAAAIAEAVERGKEGMRAMRHRGDLADYEDVRPRRRLR